MSKASIMDELEALKTVTSSNENDDSSNARKGQERASSQWVSHFVAVFAMREQFIASGGKPEEFTKTVAQKMLLADWDQKRETPIGVSAA